MKKQLIFGILVIVAILFFQHKSVPTLPLPTNYHNVGKNVQIPVIMKLANPSGENWLLTRRSNGQYIVNAYNGYRVEQAYPSGKLLLSNSNGKNFQSAGKIIFNGTSYVASQIHVNPDGSSGYIVFQPA